MTVVNDEARRAAALVLHEVLEAGAYANLSSIRLLDNRRLAPRDRSFASALIYGTISRLVAIDYLLSQVLKRPLANLQPMTRTILRLGTWQLYWSTSIPPSAAVDESVKLAHLLENPGSASLVNACLRRLSAPDRPVVPANKLALQAGLPPELFGHLKKWYGQDEAVALAAMALEAIPQVSVRVNPLRATPDQVIAELAEDGIAAIPGRHCPEALTLTLAGHSIRAQRPWNEGRITVQDEAAMLVGRIAAPEPDWQVIDLCAAPGGKTTHLAERMMDRGRVLALDVSSARLPLIAEQAQRLGLTSIRTAVADATRLDWADELIAKADLVLADVPCSGLGLLGRKPEIRLTMTHDRMVALYPLQDQILANAAHLVRPGGVLIYSTCTLNPAENQERIQAFLASGGRGLFEAGEFVLEGFDSLLPTSLLSDPLLAAEASVGMIQLLPHRHQVDGFFIAKLRRQSP
jgi:16S rRNA (cytosine967-C5)-methyltransferase